MIRKKFESDKYESKGWVKTPDAKLYYETCGQGLPLVLLHGNGQNHQVFSELIPKLRNDFFLIIPDSRAHGHSQMFEDKDGIFSIDDMADDVCHLLDALNIKRAFFLGFSDGANVALTLASRDTERALAVIAIGGNASPSGLRWCVRIFSGAFYRMAMSIKRMMDMVASAKETRRYWSRLWQQQSLILHSPNLSQDNLRKITAPVLLVVGTRDLIKPEHARWMAKSIPNCRLILVKAGTHQQFFKKKEDYLSYIFSFLKDEESIIVQRLQY